MGTSFIARYHILWILGSVLSTHPWITSSPSPYPQVDDITNEKVRPEEKAKAYFGDFFEAAQ